MSKVSSWRVCIRKFRGVTGTAKETLPAKETFPAMDSDVGAGAFSERLRKSREVGPCLATGVANIGESIFLLTNYTTTECLIFKIAIA
jgi:hypothetical protein